MKELRRTAADSVPVRKKSLSRKIRESKKNLKETDTTKDLAHKGEVLGMAIQVQKQVFAWI